MTSPWAFVVCIAVVALSGAALVQTVPHLFNSGDVRPWGIATGLSIMVTGFAILGRRLRPSSAVSDK